MLAAILRNYPAEEMRAALLAALVQPRSRVALSGASLPISPVYESGSLMYLNTQRPKLLGELSSHELLEADNRNGVLSPTLVRNTSVQQFVFVDEPSCIGCRARPRRSSSAALCHAVVCQPRCAMSSNTRALHDHRTAGYCSELARSTFWMEEDFGVARVFQQAGDETEVCSRAPLTPNPRPNLHAVNLTPIHHPHPNR